VEAPSGFSIFLSGFLVKSAVYCFYKFTSVLGGGNIPALCIVICVLGVLDASVKMWGQIDIKKLIAYATVQEMNIIYLLFVWGDA
jgi:formate hydrogenlyase subunit 3/multisubunit Na+/H+ antiporter MnhD subunit